MRPQVEHAHAGASAEAEAAGDHTSLITYVFEGDLMGMVAYQPLAFATLHRQVNHSRASSCFLQSVYITTKEADGTQDMSKKGQTQRH